MHLKLRDILLPVFGLLFILPGAATAQEANLLGRWFDDELIGSNIFNNIYNEVWGLKVNGTEYGIIGSTAGTHLIDLSDPENPEERFFIEGAVNGGEIIHRDYHDYAGYLYAVADEGASTLQIIDLTDLPASVSIVYESAALISRTHNIFIDEAAGRMYAFFTRGNLLNFAPMRIFDLSDPTDPQLLGTYSSFDGQAVGQVHDGYVRDNIAFLNCGPDGFFIVDFSDPSDPRLLKRIETYPDQGYNHSGWLSDDGDYYYMADETHGMALKAISTGNVCQAEVVGTFDAGLDNEFAITHNQIVACDYLYTSYYYDGLQVFDISDRENPVKVLEYDTYPEADGQSYKGAWGIYPLLPSGLILLSDMQTGLYIFEGVGDNCFATRELRSLDDPCDIQVSVANNKDVIRGISPQPVRSGQILTIQPGIRGGLSFSAELFSLDGRRSMARTLHTSGNAVEWRLDEHLPAGMYLLRIGNDRFSASELIQVAP